MRVTRILALNLRRLAVLIAIAGAGLSSFPIFASVPNDSEGAVRLGGFILLFFTVVIVAVLLGIAWLLARGDGRGVDPKENVTTASMIRMFSEFHASQGAAEDDGIEGESAGPRGPREPRTHRGGAPRPR